MSVPNCLEELLDWYAALTPESVKALHQWYAPTATFRDPFNQVVGHDAIAAIFLHMFETTTSPRFVILQRLSAGDQAFVTWEFLFTLRGQAYRIEGGTHFRFGADGKVIDHRDYWDAAEELFAKLPIVGAPIRWLRRQFKLPAPK